MIIWRQKPDSFEQFSLEEIGEFFNSINVKNILPVIGSHDDNIKWTIETIINTQKYGSNYKTYFCDQQVYQYKVAIDHILNNDILNKECCRLGLITIIKNSYNLLNQLKFTCLKTILGDRWVLLGCLSGSVEKYRKYNKDFYKIKTQSSGTIYENNGLSWKDVCWPYFERFGKGHYLNICKNIFLYTETIHCFIIISKFSIYSDIIKEIKYSLMGHLLYKLHYDVTNKYLYY